MRVPIESLEKGYFTKIARTFSRNWSVEVVVDGVSCPRADLKKGVIYLPRTADYLTGHPLSAMEGVLDHETAHLREQADAPEGRDPLSVLRIIADERDPLLKNLFNTFEDVRIERKSGARWPGVAKNLIAANEAASEMARVKHEKTPLSADYLFEAAIIFRGLELERLLTWMPPEVHAFLNSPEISAVMVRVPFMKDAFDALTLARMTREIIRKEANEEEEKDPEPDSEEGSGGTFEGDPEETTEGEIEGSTGGVPSSLSEDEETEEPGVPEKFARRIEADPARSDIKADAREGLTRMARVYAEAEKSRYLPHPKAVAGDRVLPMSRAPVVFRTFLNEVSSQIGGVAHRLVLLLRSSADRTVGDQESGRIDTRALASVRLGNRRVFLQERKASEGKVAVELLIDQSASMGETFLSKGRRQTRQAFALQGAIVLAEALDRARVPFEAIGFGHDRPLPRREWDPIYTRVESRNLRVFKSFDERYLSVRDRFGAATVLEQDNDDGDALLAVAYRLAARPESRKIIVVISDGDPCHHMGVGPYASRARGYLKEVIERCSAAGIEVGGLGIETDGVTSLYRHSEVVRDLSDVGPALIRLVTKMLGRAR